MLYDPWLARSYGFVLSVLATGALLLLAPRWSAALQRRRVPPRLAEMLAAAAAAQAVCAPVVVVLAARVGLVAVPCNLLAELAVGPATVLGFAALALAPVALPVAKAVAWCAAWPTEAVAVLARTGSSLPGAELDWPGGWQGGLLLAAVTVALVTGATAGSVCCAPWPSSWRSAVRPRSLVFSPAGRHRGGGRWCAMWDRATAWSWRPETVRPSSSTPGPSREPSTAA